MTTDKTTGRDLQEKTPAENYPFDFVFTSFVDGETIFSITSLTQEPRGTVDPSDPLDITNQTHDTNETGQAWLGGGTDGEYYCLTMEVLTTLGAARTCTGILFVNGACNG